jgi:hypothetical protein
MWVSLANVSQPLKCFFDCFWLASRLRRYLATESYQNKERGKMASRLLTRAEAERINKVLGLDPVEGRPTPQIEKAIRFGFRNRLNTVEKVLDHVVKGDSPLQFLINADLLAWTVECIAQRVRNADAVRRETKRNARRSGVAAR